MCMREQKAERDSEGKVKEHRPCVLGEEKRKEEKKMNKRGIELWRVEGMEEKGVQILRKRDTKGFWLRGN